ncbi:MAG: GGDEF domain-containing protein [Actinomycetota bacterium]|jgi:diguanylate cyclase (GGDEF)-like protein|nr:GGDEF domain-containing protein [Actinomycetota bacterium]
MKDTLTTTSRWTARIISAPAPILIGLSLALIALVALLDTLTGFEVSFSVFYLVPVSFAAWLLSRWAGRAIAVASAGVWGYLEFAMGHQYSASWIPYWNTAVRLAFFLLVAELIDRLRIAHSNERALSRTDMLTGIANSRVFLEQADRNIAQMRRRGLPFTLIYADLDHFKHVNDELGHVEGDRLLRTVAGIMADGVRTTDLVARLGGDEFAILMPDTEAQQARVSLERISDRIKSEVGARWAVGATFGAVTFSEPPTDVDCAVRRADALMYKGKAAGRGVILQETWPEAGGDCESDPRISVTEA